MFKVFFGGVEIYSASQVEPAIAFALEVHRISNVDHVVNVRRVSALSGVEDVVTLSLQSDKSSSK